MKLAIIGTGIAGNTAAYYLNQSHDITVYEANDYIGGHTHTHDVEFDGQGYNVDTGFIVFNERTYPHFISLLDKLGVDSQVTEMSFSVSDQKSGLEYNGHNLNTLFAQRRNLFRPSFHRMIRDILRFNEEAPEDLANGFAESTLGDYLDKGCYSREFMDHYILPMGSAIWSTDTQGMLDFPAKFFIRFFNHHGLLQLKDRPRWFVIKGGSKSYVKALTENYREHIRLSSPVTKVTRFHDHVMVEAKDQPEERFDAVFIASHSDQALAMLSDPSSLEKEILGAIKYQANEAVLHTDRTLLPKAKRAWAAWNYHLNTQEQNRAAVTYNMNILQGLTSSEPFCVTLNHTDAINPNKIIKRINYAHPVFTNEALQAQNRRAEINGPLRTFYCGAYWKNGFHEDGVVSAKSALEDFDVFLNRLENEQLHLRRAG